MTAPLPKLLDCRAIMAETGLKRCGAEAVIRACPVVVLPGLRRIYVRRSDVEALLERQTFTSDEVPI